MTLSRFSHVRAMGLLVSLVVFSTFEFGCGSDDGIGKRYPVSGTVTYDGKPLPKGSISFIPSNSKDGRAANGNIVEGAYTLTTQSPDDGALPGQYKVTVTAVDVDLSKAEAVAKKSGMMINQADIAKAKRTSLLPSKYMVPETSGLTATVKEETNRLDFPLSD